MREDERRSRPRAKNMRREMTKAEVILWNRLREANRHGFKFRRQHPIGPFIANFVHMHRQLLVEIDGDTHGTAAERESDARRTTYMRAQGWTVIRFTNAAVYEDVSAVVDAILVRLRPHPARALRSPTSCSATLRAHTLSLCAPQAGEVIRLDPTWRHLCDTAQSTNGSRRMILLVNPLWGYGNEYQERQSWHKHRSIDITQLGCVMR